jgi:hypothetical protein
MYNLETVESLHAYGRRLQSDGAQFAVGVTPRRGTLRQLVRRVRRSA